MRRVPQSSLLAPIMFLVYINDLNHNIGTETYMNIANIQRTAKDEMSCKELQEVLSRLQKGSYQWQMTFSSHKCN